MVIEMVDISDLDNISKKKSITFKQYLEKRLC